MSRVGKEPVVIPTGVEARIENTKITVKGPKGELSREIPNRIKVEQKDAQLIVQRASDLPEDRSLHGLVRSLINNMVIG
ncbi:MAG: 50S ribosomal protein L6, partial [Actinobacteria bacterium]